MLQVERNIILDNYDIIKQFITLFGTKTPGLINVSISPWLNHCMLLNLLISIRFHVWIFDQYQNASMELGVSQVLVF